VLQYYQDRQNLIQQSRHGQNSTENHVYDISKEPKMQLGICAVCIDARFVMEFTKECPCLALNGGAQNQEESLATYNIEMERCEEM